MILTKCDFCRKSEQKTIVLPCGFQVCECHVKDKDVNELQECKLCSKRHGFKLRDVYETTTNKIRKADWELEEKIQELGENVTFFRNLQQDKSHIKSEDFRNIIKKIERRNNELRAEFEIQITESFKRIKKQFLSIQDIYFKELEEKFSYVNFDEVIELSNHILEKKDTIDSRQRLEYLNAKLKEIDDIKLKFEVLSTTLKKSSNIDFILSENNDFDIKNKFGSFKYMNNLINDLDRIDYFKSLEKRNVAIKLETVFNINDLSNAKLPDLETVKEDTLKTLRGHHDKITGLDQLTSGDYISCSDDGTIKIWSKETGQCKKTLSGNTNKIKCFKVLTLGKVIGCYDSYRPSSARSSYSTCRPRSSSFSSIRIWDLTTGETLKVLQGPQSTIYSIDAYDENTLLTGHADGKIRVWDIEAGNCIRAFEGHTENVYSIKILSPKEIISASADHTVKLWDYESGKCLRTFKGHTGYVWCLAIVNDDYFLSGSYDNTVKLWNKNEESSIRTFSEHKSMIRNIKMLDNNQFFSCSFDGTLIVWDLEKGEFLKKLNFDKLESREDHTISWKDESNLFYCIELTKSSDILLATKENTIKVYS